MTQLRNVMEMREAFDDYRAHAYSYQGVVVRETPTSKPQINGHARPMGLLRGIHDDDYHVVVQHPIRLQGEQLAQTT